MGIDVEFSATRPTTGIAGLEGDHLTLERAGTAWKSREAQIPSGLHPSVITINGPLLPLGADLHMRRHVEPLFICAPFHITVGDPALVVIVGRRIGVASGIHSDSLQRTGSWFLCVHTRFGTNHQGVAWQSRPVAVFDTESLLSTATRRVH